MTLPALVFGAALRRAATISVRRSLHAPCASGRRYTKKHEWVLVAGNVGTVGITDFAQEQLGDVVYVELPDVGRTVNAGEAVGAVESVKAASDIYSPVSGTVTEKNTKLDETAGQINKSPYEDGWLFKLKLSDPSQLKALLDDAAYEKFKKEEEAAH